MKTKLLFLLCGLAAFNANAGYIWVHVTNVGSTPSNGISIQKKRTSESTWANHDAISSLSVGETDIAKGSATTGDTYDVRMVYDSVVVQQWQMGPIPSSTENYYIDFDPANPTGSGDWEYEKCVVNGSGDYMQYRVNIDGEDPGPWGVVGPGGDFCFSYSDSTKKSFTIESRPAIYDQEGNLIDDDRFDETEVSVSTSDPHWHQGDGGPAPSSTDMGIGASSASPDGNITWNPDGTDLAKDQTLRDVGEVLHSDIDIAGRQIASAIGAVRSGLSAIEVINQLTANNTSGLATGIDSVNSQMITLNSTAASSDAKLSGIQSNTAQTVSELASARSWLSSIYSELENTGNVTDQQLAQLQAMGLTFTEVRDGIQLIQPDVAGIRSAVDGIALVLQGIEESNEGIETGVQDVVDEIGNQTTEIASQSSTLQDIANNTDEIEGKLDETNSGLADVNTKLDGLGAKLERDPQPAGDTSGQGQAASTEYADKFNAAANSEPQILPLPGADLRPFEITLPAVLGQGPWVISPDPKSNPMIDGVFSFVRSLVLWFITLGLMYVGIKDTIELMKAGAAANQARSAGTSVLGWNVNTASALIMAGLITAALATLPAMFFNQFGLNPFANLGDPLQGGTNIVNFGLYFLDCFFPILEAMSAVIGLVVWKLSSAGVYWVSTTTVRFLVG